MHRGALSVLLLAAFCAPCHAAKQVTVQQLESILSASGGKPDAEVAAQLSELDLSERAGAAQLQRLQAQAPGPRSREALAVLADLSAFLPVSGADVLPIGTPDAETQRQFVALAVNYALDTVHRLPNFSAVRVTTTFQGEPWQPDRKEQGTLRHGAVRPIGTVSADISYRDGGEVVRNSELRSQPAAQGLTTAGEFGPILNTALLDAAHGRLAWSHWERSAHGVLAVFHYSVPAGQSHYDVKYCCVWRQNGDRVYFDQFTGYRGEISIDPATGSILRLTLMADLRPTDPLVRAGILVEYGPVLIGGKSYICPLRSVALSTGLEIRGLEAGSPNSLGLLQTTLNDAVFDQYHLFRADVRVLPAAGGEQHPAEPH